jgi:hypothetical protein
MLIQGKRKLTSPVLEPDVDITVMDFLRVIN